MARPFKDRNEAGQALVPGVRRALASDMPLILGLPRGGVPVAWELARSLSAELDVLVVRKLGVPFHPELAMGAIASGGARVLNDDVLLAAGITPDALEKVEQRERDELARREALFREGRPPLDVRGREVVLVDDGVATGATMEAAVMALRSLDPVRLLIAVPVSSVDAAEHLGSEVDAFTCLSRPDFFGSVGQWYETFDQTSSDDVRRLLADASERP
ncbi:putative phosphoribosyltransferase [Tamilnaduibacter salinus]|uniref:Putative phosphoribosyltransferase n=1 Tax=Tamilnaduibacter salinus TaxID=1484056 RepID=A0A2U1CTL1_9GAMM|nr:phosphoribosyltransferase [Tamilnaduibacter salinus]PVY70053.1 putative phosphoribosyltransferase [Tamilnaduibacter salinus]